MRTVPCVLMRGGTSKGPVFLANHLPTDPQQRDEVLLSLMGSGHELEIDGIGGGSPQTSKVAIVSASSHPDADVDYLFVQVMVAQRRVDTAPNCGNMLCAIGPFAIEHGLVNAAAPVTRVRIRNVNTNTLIDSEVLTPNGRVRYEGDTSIDGVPGSAAPVTIGFLDTAGPVARAALRAGSHYIDVTAEQPSAQASFDENGSPQVNIRLDGRGGDLMNRATRNNVGRSMAVIFIEQRPVTRHVRQVVDGVEKEVELQTFVEEKKIISLATIQSPLGSQFRITGLDGQGESSELALLLRAGGLAAPMYFAEERTIGPSLGADNITKGINASLWGMLFVSLFIIAIYRFFGIIATFLAALALGLVVADQPLVVGAHQVMTLVLRDRRQEPFPGVREDVRGPVLIEPVQL